MYFYGLRFCSKETLCILWVFCLKIFINDTMAGISQFHHIKKVKFKNENYGNLNIFWKCIKGALPTSVQLHNCWLTTAKLSNWVKGVFSKSSGNHIVDNYYYPLYWRNWGNSSCILGVANPLPAHVTVLTFTGTCGGIELYHIFYHKK